jgi:tetratricopeptide (TPR) repeat protein
MSYSNLISEAINQHQSGNLAKANEIYSSVLAIDPNHLQALCLSGGLAQQAGDFTRAIALFMKAKQLSPAMPAIYLQLGICYSNIGELETANALYKQASLLAPNQIEPMVNLANNLTKLYQFQEALELYKQALLITPTSALLHYNIGTLFLKSMKPEDAQEWLRKSIELDANHASAWNSLGVALTELGQIELALSAYNKAIYLDPQFEEPLFNSHTVLIDLGRSSDAIIALEKVSKLAPANPTYRFFLGLLQTYTGDSHTGNSTLDSIANEEGAFAEIASWEYLKTLDLQSATLVGSGTKTIDIAFNEAKLNGLILEFGVYNGKSIRYIASLTDSKVHGFDSFEGIPENWNTEPSGSYSANGQLPTVPNNVTLHQGWFDQTIPLFKKQNTEPIRFINIDCDLYSSTKTIFALLGPQMVSGTVIVFDELIGYQSWKEDEFKAFQEAVLQYRWQYKLLCFSFATKQVAIKII